MASMYYLLALTVLLGVASGQGTERFQQPFQSITGPLIKGIVGNPYLCEACENLVGFLKNATENKETLEELVSLLLPVCDWVPYVMHQECLTQVNDIPEYVKQYANIYLDPQRDCAYVCQASVTYKSSPEMLSNLLGQMQRDGKRYN